MIMNTNILLVTIFVPIFFSTLMYIHRVKNKFIIALIQLLVFGFTCLGFLQVYLHGPLKFVVGGWSESKGVPLQLDLTSATMMVITSFLFLLFFIYEWNKLLHERLLVLLLYILESLLLALFLSHDLFNIFVLLEVTTILVSILIMFKKVPESYYDALIYLLTNIVGMSFYLLGLGFIYKMYGSFNIDILTTTIANSEVALDTIIPYSFVLTGIAFKMGIIPIFTWKIRASSSVGSPIVLSAVLSAIYLNVGFLYFIKIQNMFLPAIDNRTLFLILGVLTAIVGSIFALVQSDILRLLAYSTVSQAGFIMIGLNLPSKMAGYGSLYHIVSHSVFKTLLLLSSAIAIDYYKSRNFSRIHGLLERLPSVGYAIIIGILGITGAPLFTGSIGKYLIGHGDTSLPFQVLIYFINFLTVLYFAKFLFMLFGKINLKDKVYFNKKIVMYVLSLLCILGGILGPLIIFVLFNYDMHFDTALYLKKFGIYILMILAAIIVYKNIFRKSKLVAKIRGIDLNFNIIVSMIFGLFVIIFSYTYYTIL